MTAGRTRRRRQTVLLIGAIAIGGQLYSASLAADATQAATATTIATATPISWLAAGDSYSSGEGLPHSTGHCARAQYGSGSATWAAEAYHDLHSQKPRLQRPDLVACTGAVTTDLIRGKDALGSSEWRPSMGRFDLVTFTFGGDNIGFAPIIEQCIGLSRLVATTENAAVGDIAPRYVTPLPSDPGHTCPAASTIRNRIQSLGRTYRTFLTQVADQVTVPGGNIVVLGYPELVELPKYWALWEQKIGACWGIGTGDATELRGLAGDLNATIGAAVSAVNAQAPNHVHMTFVDVNTANNGTAHDDPDLFEPSSGSRHNLCSSDPWMNGWNSIDYGHGSFHPKQAGLDAEGTLAATFIAKLNWSGLPSSTEAADVAPVNANGQPKPGYTITNAGTAQSCEAGSDVAPQAYRCFAGDSVYDPCWLDNADAAQATVLCQPDPGETRAIRLTVAARGLPAFLGPAQRIDRQHPWGVQLADGEECIAVQGSHDNDNGKVVDYSCGSSYRHVLLRPIDHSSPLWTAHSAYYKLSGYQPGPLEDVATAWYATPDNGAAADARVNDCTATALAYAAQVYEAAHNDPNGPLPAINAQACDHGYAEMVFTASGGSGYTAAMAFQASSSGWQEIGSSGYIQPGSFGMPASVGQAINNSLTSGPQTESVTF